MNFLDKEGKILEMFRMCNTSQCLAEDGVTRRVFHIIRDEINWTHWVDNSDKSAPPPDYYSDKFKMMMDVMRVDDHAYVIEKKGSTKIINPVSAREAKIQKDLKDSGMLEQFPNLENVIVIPKLPELTTKEFRNYGRYKNNFARVINKHKESIRIYRKNHPGYKLIFFVMDEAEEYIEAFDEDDAHKDRTEGDMVFGRRHIPPMDAAFLEPIVGSDIDFLIWFTPFKLLHTPGFEIADPLPKVCIIDVSKIDRFLERSMRYDENKMMSNGI